MREIRAREKRNDFIIENEIQLVVGDPGGLSDWCSFFNGVAACQILDLSVEKRGQILP